MKCWGDNSAGQIGDGTKLQRLSPTPVSSLTNVVAIGSGTYHTCALTGGADFNRVYCWGDGQYGECGDGLTTGRTVPHAIMSNISALSVGYFGACAIDSTAAVSCWGLEDVNTLGSTPPVSVLNPSTEPALAGAIQTAIGWNHHCAVFPGGNDKCWLTNGSGQVGDGSTTDRTAPVGVIGLATATATAAGGFHSCALTAAGTISCWGQNGSGQLGDGTTADKHIPTPVVWP